MSTYGYSQKDYQKFKKYAWLMLLSFGLTYLFFYNGRQNINLVLKDMAAGPLSVWLPRPCSGATRSASLSAVDWVRTLAISGL